MTRIEIIGNVELLEELQAQLLKKFPNYYYTVLDVLKGFGKKGYALGDDTWPESNFCCVLFVDDNVDLQAFKKMTEDIQTEAPQNAITIFAFKLQQIM